MHQIDQPVTFLSMMPSHEARHAMSRQKFKLPVNFAPTRYAVLCGRGKACSASPGNRHLRSMVQSYLADYSKAKNKLRKSVIVSTIVDAVRKQAPDGAFIKKDKDGHWWEMGDTFAREKIGCIFRDALHTQYRSSTKAKFARKQADKIGGGSLLNDSHSSQSSLDSSDQSDRQEASSVGQHCADRATCVDGTTAMSTLPTTSSSLNPEEEQVTPAASCHHYLHLSANGKSKGDTPAPVMTLSGSDRQEIDKTNRVERRLLDVVRDFASADSPPSLKMLASMVTGDAFFQTIMQEAAELDDCNFPEDLSDIFD